MPSATTIYAEFIDPRATDNLDGPVISTAIGASHDPLDFCRRNRSDGGVLGSRRGCHWGEMIAETSQAATPPRPEMPLTSKGP